MTIVHLLDDINNRHIACGKETLYVIFHCEDYELTEEKVSCKDCLEIINRRK